MADKPIAYEFEALAQGPVSLHINVPKILRLLVNKALNDIVKHDCEDESIGSAKARLEAILDILGPEPK